jgi:hypothetical protein
MAEELCRCASCAANDQPLTTNGLPAERILLFLA